MKTKKLKAIAVCAGVVGLCVGMLTGFVPADADTVNATGAVAAVQRVAPEAVSDVATTTTGPGAAVQVSVSGVDVSVPVDPSEGVQVSGGADVGIGLPFAGHASNAVESHEPGVVVYDNNNGSSTIPVTHTDGTLQISTVIEDASAPERYDYPVTLGAGQSLHLSANGSAYVADEIGSPLLHIAAPWAKDANGAAVPTRYELSGNTLTQVVDFAATTAFPVVADPTVAWLWWGRTITYTKAETKQVAGFASTAQVFSYLCIVGGLAGAACTTLANLGFQIVKNAATNALRAGRCIQLNIPYVGPGLIYDVTC